MKSLFASLITSLIPSVIAAVLLLAACTPALDWREHRFDDGGFTILLPQKPGRAERRLATPTGEVTMKMVSVRVDDTVFGAASADFAAAPDAAAQDAMRNALLKNFDGSIVSDKPVNTGLLSGREIVKRGRFGAGGSSASTQAIAANTAANAVSNTASNTAVNTAPNTASNTSANTAAATAAEGELRARFFVKGNRYYQIIVAGRRGAITDADLDLFFTSFKPD